MGVDMDEIRASLKRTEEIAQRTEESTKRIEQAVFGDTRIGLNGLVNDVSELKNTKSKWVLKSVTIAGIISGVVVGGKGLLAKIGTLLYDK